MVRTISSFILMILLLPFGFVAGAFVLTAYLVLFPAVILFTAYKIADYLSSLLFGKSFEEEVPLSLSQYIGVGLSVIPAAIAVSVFTVLAAPIFLILCTGSFSHSASNFIVEKVANYFEDGEVFVQPHINTYLTHFLPVEVAPRTAAKTYSTYDLNFFPKSEALVSGEKVDEKQSHEPSNHIKLNFYQNPENPTTADGCQPWREERPNSNFN